MIPFAHNLLWKVGVRKNRKQLSSKRKPKMMYPLYSSKSLKESYNFHNIKDSIYHWDSYSSSVQENWNQMMKLFETIVLNGNIYELQECTSIINRDIIPDLESPSMIKEDVYHRLDKMQMLYGSNLVTSCYFSMLKTLNENIECDRLLSNFETISHRFDINKYIKKNVFLEDKSGIILKDTIYNFCSLIDTYDMDYKSKFCIAVECALYGLSNIFGTYMSKADMQSILETAFDYFLMNYGKQDTSKFLTEMKDTCHKDPFIVNALDEYIMEFEKMNIESLEEESQAFIRTDDILDDNYYKEIQMIKEDLSESINKYRSRINFQDISNKANNLFNRLKLMPGQTVGTIKSAIRSLLVPCRIEDLAKGTHNALAYVFYACITLGLLSVGSISALLGLICSILISRIVQKQYFKESIKEWKDHRYGVQRKLNDCTDPTKRNKIQAYLQELDAMINKLEEKYESMRDKTVAELHKEQEERYKYTHPTDRNNGDTDPNGNSISFESEG